ncbi:hypothetical protein KL941_004650 [Ogataea angusta]|nr:hypothetical protein KL941_004650 [Ogataea angusta]
MSHGDPNTFGAANYRASNDLVDLVDLDSVDDPFRDPAPEPASSAAAFANVANDYDAAGPLHDNPFDSDVLSDYESDNYGPAGSSGGLRSVVGQIRTKMGRTAYDNVDDSHEPSRSTPPPEPATDTANVFDIRRYFRKHNNTDDTSPRTIYINDPQTNARLGYYDNHISTTKYNFVTFVPKFLFEQFSKYANLFFLFTSVIQQVPSVSPTNRYTTIGTLMVVLLVSAVKEITEDIKRNSSDNELNRAVLHRDGEPGRRNEPENQAVSRGDRRADVAAAAGPMPGQNPQRAAQQQSVHVRGYAVPERARDPAEPGPAASARRQSAQHGLDPGNRGVHGPRDEADAQRDGGADQEDRRRADHQSAGDCAVWHSAGVVGGLVARRHSQHRLHEKPSGLPLSGRNEQGEAVFRRHPDVLGAFLEPRADLAVCHR